MSGKTLRASVWVCGILLFTALASGAYWSQSRRAPGIPTIALIPQTAGAMLWDVEHFGATVAAEKLKCRLYWNAPTSENDVAGQISLIDRIGRGKYQGLVLAPNHSLGVLAPLHRVLAAGLPVVIVSSMLDLPAGDKLGYVVNDDEKMGELAAAEIARLVGGKGSVALAGVTRYAPGVMRRAHSAERYLASRFPEIQVVGRLGGAFNPSRAEELTNGAMDKYPDLKAVLGLTAPATRGVHTAVKGHAQRKAIRIVGCDQDSDLMGYVASGEIAAVVSENTYRMGYEAVSLIAASLAGHPLPPLTLIPPSLITRQNLGSAEVSQATSFPK